MKEMNVRDDSHVGLASSNMQPLLVNPTPPKSMMPTVMNTKYNNLQHKKQLTLSKEDIHINYDTHPYTQKQLRDIQSAIEKGISSYRSKLEIMAVLKNVDADVVNLMFQKLEQKNPKYFTAYLIRLAFMKQVKVFNEFVLKQYHELKHHGMDAKAFASSLGLQESDMVATQLQPTSSHHTASQVIAPIIPPPHVSGGGGAMGHPSSSPPNTTMQPYQNPYLTLPNAFLHDYNASTQPTHLAPTTRQTTISQQQAQDKMTHSNPSGEFWQP